MLANSKLKTQDEKRQKTSDLQNNDSIQRHDEILHARLSSIVWESHGPVIDSVSRWNASRSCGQSGSTQNENEVRRTRDRRQMNVSADSGSKRSWTSAAVRAKL